MHGSIPPRARSLPDASGPRVPNAHLFAAGERPMLLSVERGRIYPVDKMMAQMLDRAMQHGDAARAELFMVAAGLGDIGARDAPVPASVPVRALSLAVAQKCNLGCTYCYAQQGNFGGRDSNMAAEVARASVDRLLQDAAPGEKVTLAYLGGEPLANRAVLRATTQYAAQKATAAGIGVSFAVTTNATLLTEDDAAFFDRYAFTVTVSIDGVGDVHDALRPFKSGRGSYERVVERSRLLLARSPRRCRVLARVTVTPRNLSLPETLEELVKLGFDGVSFTPVVRSPTGSGEMAKDDFARMLAQMIACGRAFEQRLAADEVYPFSNIVNTLRQIHEGKRETYPCGAGGGYLGVSSKGDLFACHRFVDDDVGAMGNVTDGVDRARQARWLAARNVHAQEPCGSCWARYLCSGGCHHEAIHRGRRACDYIRGWLHYCLGVYARLALDDPPLLARILQPEAIA